MMPGDILETGRKLPQFAQRCAEVFVIGLVGVGLGTLLGQAITAYLVVPFIAFQMNQGGLVMTIQPVVSLGGVLPAVISAFVVLVVSAIKPAQDAAKTKVIHRGFDDPPKLAAGAASEEEALTHYRRVRDELSRATS